ncbi:MAG TPA: tRNA adenosine(34) deaminase TadA [Pseudolysinimonas sp.]|nr:tRNA adenosine(34) deaminase TadA [Pseudolysinimonas sp.]
MAAGPAAGHEDAMRTALAEAEFALASGDVPVGAVLLDADGSVLAHAHNEREATHDPTAHAEVLAIRRAAEVRGAWHLEDTTLVVTLEPCVLCAGAILAARIPRVVFGAWDEKAGAAGSVHDLLRDRRLPHRVEVTPGVLADDGAALLSRFFAERR